MLSKKARHAFRALFVLANHRSSAPMMISDIADRAGVPRKFLEQILLDLKRTGIVTSHRGKYGGYSLGRAPQEISFAEIIRTTDGPLALTPCVSATAYRRCEDCPDEKSCAIRKVLLAVRNATASMLESHSLADATTLRPAKRGKSRLIARRIASFHR
jgi:Rrf2 family protein